MSDLVVRQENWIDVRGPIGLTGWQPPEDLTVEEWSDVMHKAGMVNRMAGWVIGDGLVASDRKWGEMYTEAEELTGLACEYLSKLRLVSEAVNFRLRSPNLTVSHHREIAKFRDDPDLQAHWLAEAERNRWSVRQLREAIAQAEAEEKAEEQQDAKQEPEDEQEAEQDNDAPVVLRYQGGYAHCKYCYQTHDDWTLADDTPVECWICSKCQHAIADDRMDLREEPEEEPKQEEDPEPEKPRYITLDAWNAGERWDGVLSNATLNQTNDNIEWAAWSWNPVTGCLHGCDYCYARDIANRFYPQKFQPSFVPERLAAPANTRSIKARWTGDIGYRNVFTCSMADLFGKWVPQEWIEAVLQTIADNPQWTFLLLSKFPVRMAEFTYPPNVWLGTTVDKQWAVDRAEKAFRKIKASGFDGVCWLSCEPMLERLTFESLDMFDWVVMGGSSRSTQTPEYRPPFDDIVHLYEQARAAGCQVYQKTNLIPGMSDDQRIREYPLTPDAFRGTLETVSRVQPDR